MTLLKVVFSLTLLCAATGFPSSGKLSADTSDSRLSDWSETAETGKNWLARYVSLLSSVIPSAETASLIPTEAGKQTRDTRSSDPVNITRPAVQHNTSNPFCPSVSIKHIGKKVPLIKPTSGNIYKDKSHGDPEHQAAHQAARSAVSANSGSTAFHRGETIVTASNSTPRESRESQAQWSLRRLDVCSAVWPSAPPQRLRSQNSTKDDEYVLEYLLTLEVPSSTTPMTPKRPTAEPVVAECNLPPPYQNDRYDWLEVLAAYGGLPGCVNGTQQAPEHPVTVVNDTCERPLPDDLKGEDIYSYIHSDLQNFYREETAKLRFPGMPNQFLDIRGILVWTAPSDDGNVYVLEYDYDDTGLWLHIPEQTCRFVDTATLTCTTRQHCWCQDGKETCLGVQALPGNLLATLVGGG